MIDQSMVSPTISSVTEDELAFIAALDYGQKSEQHLVALRQVIFEQDGIPAAGQIWFPYEVIELGARHLESDHAREFAICTLLVIGAVEGGFDSSTDLSQKFHDRAAGYDRLPIALRAEILAAYANARLSDVSELSSSYVPRDDVI